MSLTNMGKVFILIMIALLFAGLNTKSNLLHLFNAFLICLWLLSPILAQRNAKNLKLNLDTPEEVFTGQVCPIQFFFNNNSIYDKYALNFVDSNSKKWLIPHIPAQTKIMLALDNTYTTRGVINWKSISLNTSYPFNFFNCKLSIPLEHKLYVLPRPFPIHSLPLEIYPSNLIAKNMQTSKNQNSKDEFSMLREYREGDSIRNIDWKASARKDSFIVKEFSELLPLSCSISVCFLSDKYISKETNDSFEMTIYSTASLVWNICQRGQIHNFTIGSLSLSNLKGATHAKKVLRLLAEQQLQDIAVPQNTNAANMIIITNRPCSSLANYVQQRSAKTTIVYADHHIKDDTISNTIQYKVHFKENNMRLEKLC